MSKVKHKLAIVYQAIARDEGGRVVAVYVGKHRCHPRLVDRDEGHRVFHDSYAGGGVYLYSTGNRKWPTYNYLPDSWPGLLQINPQWTVQMRIAADFQNCKTALGFEQDYIKRVRLQYGDLCVNKPPDTCKSLS